MKLLKFEKDSCQPCEQVGKYLDAKGVQYNNIKAFDEPEIAVRYKVRGVPTLMLVDENDEEVGRVVGFKPLEIDKLIQAI